MLALGLEFGFDLNMISACYVIHLLAVTSARVADHQMPLTLKR